LIQDDQRFGTVISSQSKLLLEKPILNLCKLHRSGALFVVIGNEVDPTAYGIAAHRRASWGFNSSDAAATFVIPGSSHKS
jgi:hypothetical protein